MKTLPFVLGLLVANIVFGEADAQMASPQGGYTSPPVHGPSISPQGAEGRSVTRPKYPYHHSGTRGRLRRGASPRHPEGPGNPRG
jgi:hypothetical protein